MAAAEDARAERGDALEEAIAEQEALLVVGADVDALCPLWRNLHEKRGSR